MPSITVKDAAAATQTIQTLPSVGQAVKAASLPVVIASDQGALSVTLSGGNTNGQATSANSAPVVIASDQSVIPVSGQTAVGSAPANPPLSVSGVDGGGLKRHVLTDTAGAVQVGATQKPTSTQNGMTSSRVNAAATTNATSLKGSAGQLYQVDVFNVAAYDVFLKFYNKASAPTVGTDTPVWTIPLKAGAGYSNVFMLGKAFSAGIAYAITKLQADTDTTAVAAGDVTGNMDWI